MWLAIRRERLVSELVSGASDLLTKPCKFGRLQNRDRVFLIWGSQVQILPGSPQKTPSKPVFKPLAPDCSASATLQNTARTPIERASGLVSGLVSCIRILFFRQIGAAATSGGQSQRERTGTEGRNSRVPGAGSHATWSPSGSSPGIQTRPLGLITRAVFSWLRFCHCD